VDLHPLATLGVAVVAGVGVDLDHFVLARFNTGSWDGLARVLRTPRLAFVGQDDIFDAGDVWGFQRLLSHYVIATAVVPALWLLARPVAVVVAAALYAHVGADLVADARDERSYVIERAAVLNASAEGAGAGVGAGRGGADGGDDGDGGSGDEAGGGGGSDDDRASGVGAPDDD
jgi:uncharacterized membrane protein YgcG